MTTALMLISLALTDFFILALKQFLVFGPDFYLHHVVVADQDPANGNRSIIYFLTINSVLVIILIIIL